MVILMKTWLVVCVLLGSLQGVVMAVQGIDYTLEKRIGEVEIRSYGPTVEANIQINASRDDAPNLAFRPLFNFIAGNNRYYQNCDDRNGEGGLKNSNDRSG